MNIAKPEDLKRREDKNMQNRWDTEANISYLASWLKVRQEVAGQIADNLDRLFCYRLEDDQSAEDIERAMLHGYLLALVDLGQIDYRQKDDILWELSMKCNGGHMTEMIVNKIYTH